MSLPKFRYALSLKQPWATLLVYGLKCIEIRSWATDLREEVLIHASQIPDSRPQAWKLVPVDLLDLARAVGGVVGSAELTGCIPYRTPAAFAADQALHLNDPAWFRPRLHGFVFARAAHRPFRRCLGNVKFFRVEVSADDRRIARAPAARPARQRTKLRRG